MIREELKEHLSQIKQNDWKTDGTYTYSEYGIAMLSYIGDTDPILRDELIYEVFDAWIAAGKFTRQQLCRILDICLDENHLKFHLGENGTDTVYARTFSALILASILYEHVADPFIPPEQIKKIHAVAVEYYEKENDLRGYTKEFGWAHSMAHGADLLEQLCACKECQKNELFQVLEVIRKKICQGDHVYIEREPNRMARAISRAAKRNLLTESEMLEWINQFQNSRNDKDVEGHFHERVNIENFFRCLYFEMKSKGIYVSLLPVIEEKTGI